MTRTTRNSAAAAGGINSILKTEPQQLSSPPPTPVPANRNTRKATPGSRRTAKHTSEEQVSTTVSPPRSTKKRTRGDVKSEEDDELPHNLGKSLDTKQNVASPAKKSRSRKQVKLEASDVADAKELVNSVVVKTEEKGSPSKKAKKPKDTTYGLTPGETPFPDWPHPTPEECHEVNDVLSKLHGAVKAPKTIPNPSLTVSGCGEVPSVLDALIRTRLSAATSGTNSSRAFQGLVQRFGTIKEGIGKGSVNWDAVRRADVKEVFEAIKSGGLAQVKSKDIKEILQQVYEENQARRAALLNPNADPAGASKESADEKDREVALAEASVISLDHLHLLPDKEAFDKLVKYPGIGPKTASCVLLFCLQRPSFAVDTHVFRLCSWLGWVPPNATRNTAYAHCDVRIPDELKYALHQLLIRHGKSCPRCRANTSETYRGWEDGCVIDHLVKRTGVRKGGVEAGSPNKKKTKKTKGKMESDEEDEGSDDSLSELSDLGSDSDSD
ncbi:DNA glycosylase [Pseudovirgaria hyperparasitica]|uniref:DNA glycosylase n=1 Tax=Pseudovirgaria hyperparasitica TaxID=470096 RepID=A0A6A6VW32_9PEZI|nr:DNA glycosylase [Pseudovirgaria hyperparasitica]KAF2753457.1 DNA glycosylase [Pseudovirgaria hyperparasitica]